MRSTNSEGSNGSGGSGGNVEELAAFSGGNKRNISDCGAYCPERSNDTDEEDTMGSVTVAGVA